MDPYGRLAAGGEPLALPAAFGGRLEPGSGAPGHVEPPDPGHVVLVDALRELPPQQRRTLTLHYLCDLTVEQIAGETGLSGSTIKTHLVRGRAALAHRLRDPRIEEAPDV